MKRVLLVIVLSVAACVASSHSRPYKHYPRSRAVTRQFQKEHPCPSTGKRSGACPGWVRDHVKALCAGGADSVSNMQWQTTADAAAKDKWECPGGGNAAVAPVPKTCEGNLWQKMNCK